MLAPPSRAVDRSAGTDRDAYATGSTTRFATGTAELAVEKQLGIAFRKNGDRFHTRDVSGTRFVFELFLEEFSPVWNQ
jgi:hypothetical protein